MYVRLCGGEEVSWSMAGGTTAKTDIYPVYCRENRGEGQSDTEPQRHGATYIQLLLLPQHPGQ